eukprot:gene3709-2609_t
MSTNAMVYKPKTGQGRKMLGRKAFYQNNVTHHQGGKGRRREEKFQPYHGPSPLANFVLFVKRMMDVSLSFSSFCLFVFLSAAFIPICNKQRGKKEIRLIAFIIKVEFIWRLRNTLNQLYVQLCKLGFPYWGSVDEADYLEGDPGLYATFLRFIFQCYPQETLQLARKHSWFLLERTPTRLAAVACRLLHEEYGHHIPMTAAQFAQKHKFACAKASVCLQLMRVLATERVARRRSEGRVFSGEHRRHAPDKRVEMMEGRQRIRQEALLIDEEALRLVVTTVHTGSSLITVRLFKKGTTRSVESLYLIWLTFRLVASVLDSRSLSSYLVFAALIIIIFFFDYDLLVLSLFFLKKL